MSFWSWVNRHSRPAPIVVPPSRTMAVSVWGPSGAVTTATSILRTDGGDLTAANQGGRLVFTLPADLPYGWTRTLHLEADGYQSRDLDVTLQGSIDVTLTAKPRFEHPRPVHRDGRAIVDDRGRPVPIRSADLFLGILLMALGEDIRPVMRYCRDTIGATWLRTFGSMHYTPTGNGLPALTPNITLAHLETYLTVAAEEGLGVDLSLGDAQIFFSGQADRQAFCRDVAGILARHPNGRKALTLNEPWKNGFDPMTDLNGLTGVLCARGSAQDENDWYLPSLDFTAQHTERSLEEDGYKWVRHQFEQWRCPDAVYFEEPIGCAEVPIDGRRDNKPDAFGQAAAVWDLVGLGGCFHCDDLMLARIPTEGSRQDQCAKAVGATRQWLRPELQRGIVTRAGLSDSVVELDDDHALRCIQRIAGDRAQVVAVRPRGYVPRPRNGWHVEQVSADGAFIDLVRG